MKLNRETSFRKWSQDASRGRAQHHQAWLVADPVGRETQHASGHYSWLLNNRGLSCVVHLHTYT